MLLEARGVLLLFGIRHLVVVLRVHLLRLGGIAALLREGRAMRRTGGNDRGDLPLRRAGKLRLSLLGPERAERPGNPGGIAAGMPGEDEGSALLINH